ncbi:FBN1 [Cordylochernes scorpioides]|uniref:FBN1 n=1 Tax=Cordylochernes scorpioides TaxID=51811 RepID=A0ABY6K5B9_9ARAC|nr:FBN1 [Cordylochernes scorpioides]
MCVVLMADINECVTIPGICTGGQCTNSEGSFRCICPRGFQLSANKKECLDSSHVVCPDTRTNPCYQISELGRCSEPRPFNMTRRQCCCMKGSAGWGELWCELCPQPPQPSFKELCPDGYGYIKEDGQMEVHVVQAMIIMVGRSWRLLLLDKQKKNSYLVIVHLYCAVLMMYLSNQVTMIVCCADINECMIDPLLCKNGFCINTDGSYRCECEDGYVLHPSGHFCIVSVCQTGMNVPLFPMSVATEPAETPSDPSNAPVVLGSPLDHVRPVKEYTKEFTLVTFFSHCVCVVLPDVDECEEMGNNCAFRCRNTPGSFRCICPYGYTLALDGLHCQDLDECQTPANKCRYQCKNLIGSFMCICHEGFQQVGMGDECVDINECVTVPDVCRNGQCINTLGGYHCQCNQGFSPTPNRQECQDILSKCYYIRDYIIGMMIVVPDHRTGLCYLPHHSGNGQLCPARTADMREMTWADCCCGMGVFWGSSCERCPLKGTSEYYKIVAYSPIYMLLDG